MSDRPGNPRKLLDGKGSAVRSGRGTPYSIGNPYQRAADLMLGRPGGNPASAIDGKGRIKQRPSHSNGKSKTR